MGLLEKLVKDVDHVFLTLFLPSCEFDDDWVLGCHKVLVPQLTHILQHLHNFRFTLPYVAIVPRVQLFEVIVFEHSLEDASEVRLAVHGEHHPAHSAVLE